MHWIIQIQILAWSLFLFCTLEDPKSYKTEIKILANPGLA